MLELCHLPQIKSVVIRQGSVGRTSGTIDGIKIFGSWSDIAPTATSTFTIAGNIITPAKKKLNSVNIFLSGAASSASLNNTNSAYSFNNLNTGNYVVKASKNNDVKKNNGVSSIDVILMQNHILNRIKFNSPYKIIAADVNNNKSVSNIDVIFMKRLILGIDTSFTGNRLWTFVDSSFVFADTTNPYPYKDSIIINNLTANKINQTFIAIKLGDVNYDWNPTLARGSKTEDLQLIVDDKKIVSENSFLKIPVSVNNFKDLVALQYTLTFSNNLYEFISIENNNLGIDFNAQQADNGKISFLWNDKNAINKTLTDGSEMFTLVLRKKEFGNYNSPLEVSLSNDITEIEAWDKNFNKHNIVLLVKKTNQLNTDLSNLQLNVSPTVTNGNVIIDFKLKENKLITMQLFNQTGKLVFTQKIDATKGKNQYSLDLRRTNNLTEGIYFLKAQGLDDGYTKKIIVTNK